MMPTNPKTLSMLASATITAAAGDSKGPPTFTMEAYTGGMIQPAGWYTPVVIELSGMKYAAPNLPIRLQHDTAQGVGHTTKISNDGKKLSAEGVISRDTEAARDVVSSAARGFPWQASVGLNVLDAEYIDSKSSVIVNGQKFNGPLNVARKTMLNEISFVDLGADTKTSADVVAAANLENENMTKEEVEAARIAEEKKQADIKAASAATNIATNPGDAAIQAAAEVAKANQYIAEVAALTKDHPEIQASALSGKWTIPHVKSEIELKVLRASRATPPNMIIVAESNLTGAVIEAAACQALRVPGHEKMFDDKTLQAAHKAFHGTIGLQELIIECAVANGYQGRARKVDVEVLRAAFSPIKAEGNSTSDISGILSNVANKFLLLGFFMVEQAWKEISAIRSVSDFKTVTSYRLTGVDQFDQVAPGGELKHGTLGSEQYSNQANTFGILMAIDRRDIINDDLGALQTVPQKLGRGAGLKLNDVFWTVFLNNSTFFTTGNGSYMTGANTTIGIDSLTAAEILFMNQTDAQGKPLGTMPTTILVPTALKTPADVLMKSTEVRNPSGTQKDGIINPHTGKYKTVMSRYLQNAAYTGNSALAWYLLGSPSDVPVIETCFLNGQETPIIQQAEADFNTLGIQMRGYHDFGVTKQDYRGGIKVKGAA